MKNPENQKNWGQNYHLKGLIAHGFAKTGYPPPLKNAICWRVFEIEVGEDRRDKGQEHNNNHDK